MEPDWTSIGDLIAAAIFWFLLVGTAYGIVIELRFAYQRHQKERAARLRAERRRRR
ncbi:MAG: hypothetical protein ACKOBG_00525 [Actinomycetota bacterium]